MNRELIVNVNPTEISIALCEDKVLVELNKEQCQTGFAVGDIYLGKVRKIMPGLNAAFVNIGHEKDAFIHYLDLGSQFSSLQKLVASYQPGKRGIRLDAMKLEPPIEKSGKIGSYLQVGQTVMVQVAKEAISTKGPRLTADISLAGRNVVLVPFSSKVFLSQKIRSAEEKKRLKGIAAAVLPKNFGVIIRTAAVEAKDSDIEQDIRSLLDKWQKTLQNIRKNPAPAQLMSEMNRANTIIRDSLGGAFSQIVVDDEAMYHEIQNYIRQIEPQSEKLVKLYRGNVPIFDNFDISKQIKSLFATSYGIVQGKFPTVIGASFRRIELEKQVAHVLVCPTPGRTAGPQRLVVELQPFLGHTPEEHSPDSPVTDRQGRCHPHFSRLVIPQFHRYAFRICRRCIQTSGQT